MSGTLCVPAQHGYLRARLRGAIDADIDWRTPQPQCRGALRPNGAGIRLVFKGSVTTGTASPDGNQVVQLTLLLGIAGVRPGLAARGLPVNLTLIRDGTGAFFATQGDDKCTIDELHQSAIDRAQQLYRLEARGYCTQPARALGDDGAVLVTRFDLASVVDFSDPEPVPGPDRDQTRPDDATTST